LRVRRGAVGLDRGALEGAVLEGSVEPLRSRSRLVPCEGSCRAKEPANA